MPFASRFLTRVALIAATIAAEPDRLRAQGPDAARNVAVPFRSGSATTNGYEHAYVRVYNWFEACAGEVQLVARHDARPAFVIQPQTYWIKGRRVQVPPQFSGPRMPQLSLNGTVRGNGITRQVKYIYAGTSASCWNNGLSIGPVGSFLPANATAAQRNQILGRFGFDIQGELPPLTDADVENHFLALWREEEAVAAERRREEQRVERQRIRAADSVARETATRQRQEQERRAAATRPQQETGRTTQATSTAQTHAPGMTLAQMRARDSANAINNAREGARLAEEQRVRQRATDSADAVAAYQAQQQQAAQRAEAQRQKGEAIVQGTTAVLDMFSQIAAERRAEKERKEQIEAANRARVAAEAEEAERVAAARRAAAAARTSARVRARDAEAAGIGASVDTVSGQLFVTRVMPGGAAHSAGIRRGDRIMTVNGHITSGWSFDQLILHTSGPAGSAVMLGLERGGLPIQLKLLRTLLSSDQTMPAALRCHEILPPVDTIEPGETISGNVSGRFCPGRSTWEKHWIALRVSEKQTVQIELNGSKGFDPMLYLFSSDQPVVWNDNSNAIKGFFGATKARLSQTVEPGVHVVEVATAYASPPNASFTLRVTRKGDTSGDSLRTAKPIVGEAGAPTAIAAVGAQVTAIRFYELGPDWLPEDAPVYATLFDAPSSRYVVTLVQITMPPNTSNTVVPITCSLVNASGATIGKVTRNLEGLPTSASVSNLQFPLGWERPGNWATGRFRMKCEAHGQLVAEGAFDMERGSTTASTRSARPARETKVPAAATSGASGALRAPSENVVQNNSALAFGYFLRSDSLIKARRPADALLDLRRAVAAGGDATVAANYALHHGNVVRTIADSLEALPNSANTPGFALRDRQDRLLALEFVQLADSIGPTPTSKLLLAVLGYDIGASALQESNKSSSCELNKLAETHLLIARANAPLGASVNPGVAEQITNAIASYWPYVEAQRRFCR